MPGPVNRRASLPGASELFRATRPRKPAEAASAPAEAARPAATGRVRHDQKITVYFSSDELFALEDATLELKRRHGMSLDRGRLVRTAVALALAELAANGEESAVVAELREQ
ncbi:MAG: hypothetical protein ACK5KO_06590 [Arachnia sp.]